MKRALVIGLILLSASLPAVYVEAKQNRRVSTADDASSSDVVQTLKQALTNVGFKEVQIVPQIFVASVRTSGGKRSMVLVDARTMQAMELEGASDFVSKASERGRTQLENPHNATPHQ
jgi:hypothetical protein